jgi:transcriptional regulator with XRE-family HTH domain
MPSLGEKLRLLREQNSLLLREVAAQLQIDPSMLSKIEREEKRPTKQHVQQLSKIYNVQEKDLMVPFLSEKVLFEIKDEEFGLEALKAAEAVMRLTTKPRTKSK